VPPLTAAEVTQLENGLGGFQQPGIAVGAPVPLMLTNDAPTCRDVAGALEQVVSGLLQRPFRTRIGVGTSSGARLFAALDFGRSVIGTQSVRTGGNHVVPYDAGSARIFDGFILKNLTHITRDIVAETTQPSNGDRLGCFMSAAVRNLRVLLQERKAPPRSRMAGRIVGGELRFDQADGSTTNVAPIPNDPTRDTYVVDATLTPRTIGSAETARWLAVTSALPHECDAIIPPTVACRLGGYKLMFFGSQLVPLPPAILSAKYGSFENYRDCVCRTVADLEAQCPYDQRVESGRATAELARALFD
jgi:hypothetical protein